MESLYTTQEFTLVRISIELYISLFSLYRWNSVRNEKGNRDTARLWMFFGFLSFALDTLLTSINVSFPFSILFQPLAISFIITALNEIMDEKYSYYLPIALTLTITLSYSEILEIYTIMLSVVSIGIVCYIGIRHKVNDLLNLGIFLILTTSVFIMNNILALQNTVLGVIVSIKLVFTLLFIHQKVIIFKEES